MAKFKYIRPEFETIPEGTKRVTVHAIVEDCFVDAWLAWIGDKPWAMLVDDCDSLGFDRGGMVLADEPVLEGSFDGFTFSVRLTMAEDLLKWLNREPNDNEALGRHVWIPGYWTKLVMSIETAFFIREWLSEEMRDKVGAADQWLEERLQRIRRAGVGQPRSV